MRFFPDRFDSDVEAEFLASRTADRWALLRWSAAAVAPQYLVIGLWDEMIDPGSFGSTWPIRVSLTVSYLVLLAVIWRKRSVDGARNAWWVGYAISAVGLALILGEIEGGTWLASAGSLCPLAWWL